MHKNAVTLLTKSFLDKILSSEEKDKLNITPTDYKFPLTIIITPENPIKNCLSQEYDNISNIDVYAIPGPGLPCPFIGIQAYTTNAIACYVLEHNSFKLIKEFSTIEWERAKMYT